MRLFQEMCIHVALQVTKLVACCTVQPDIVLILNVADTSLVDTSEYVEQYFELGLCVA